MRLFYKETLASTFGRDIHGTFLFYFFVTFKYSMHTKQITFPILATSTWNILCQQGRHQSCSINEQEAEV